MKNSSLISNIINRDIAISILGLGYVGLPLASSFVEAGFLVYGLDTNQNKVGTINKGISNVKDLPNQILQENLKTGKLVVSNNFSYISEARVIIICVPTPLDSFKKPDMSYIEASCKSIAQNLKPGSFICLESTTYPTTTELFVKPIIEQHSGLKEGRDFWLAFSPERINPGDQSFAFRDIPKIVGGLGIEANSLGKALYSTIVDTVHEVSSPRIAEMAKVLENTYRLVNISLINELALFSGRIGIDIWEVIRAAKTKPYGFEAFYPGPGIGGHCIPFDPFYLEHIARGMDFNLSIVNAAGNVNNQMSYRIMNKISYALNRHSKSLNGSHILFLGVAYKADIADYRESPALAIMEHLERKLAVVSYYDPYVPECIDKNGNTISSIVLNNEYLNKCDCVVLTTKHSNIDYEWVVSNSKIIVDTRNVIESVAIEDGKVFKL